MISVRQSNIVTAFILIAISLASPTSFASPQAGGGWTTAKLIAIHPDSVLLLEQNGVQVTASLTPSSILIHRGVPTLSLKDFPNSSSVDVRLRPSTREGGRPRVEVLADAQTGEAITAYGKKPLTGSVCGLMPGWLIVKTDDFSAVPVELTSSTVYQRAGSVVSTCPFNIGDRVTIAIHASTTGTLIASSAADQDSEPPLVTALPAAPTLVVKGTIYSIKPEDHELTVLTSQQAQIAVSVPPNITTIRKSRNKVTLGDLQIGMKVVVHLEGGVDSAGYVARSISASP